MTLHSSRQQSHGKTIVTIDIGETPRHNSWQLSHISITTVLGIEEMPLPNSRRMSHGGVEEMLLSKFKSKFWFHPMCWQSQITRITEVINRS